jgi:hypothetical protein
MLALKFGMLFVINAKVIKVDKYKKVKKYICILKKTNLLLLF